MKKLVLTLTIAMSILAPTAAMAEQEVTNDYTTTTNDDVKTQQTTEQTTSDTATPTTSTQSGWSWWYE